MGPNQALLSRKRESWPLDHGADAFGDRPEQEPILEEDVPIPKEHAPDALVRLSKEFPGEKNPKQDVPKSSSSMVIFQARSQW